jgi:hypothetical protein
MALNALSSQQIDLPPLPSKALREACQEAFRIHCGETLCVSSTINGGGKTHYIMTAVSKRQKQGENLSYYKIPIRESTTPAKLIDIMSNIPRHAGE